MRLNPGDTGDFAAGIETVVFRLEPLGLRLMDFIVEVKPSRKVVRGVDKLRNESREGETCIVEEDDQKTCFRGSGRPLEPPA